MLYIYHIFLKSMPRQKQEYIRYMCQFRPEQYDKLKKASEDGIPMAYHIRLAVDNYFQEQG